MQSSVDFSEIHLFRWRCRAWQDPTIVTPACGDQSETRAHLAALILDPAQPFQQNNPAHRSMLAAICFTSALHLLHQHISPALPQEQAIFNLKHKRQANCTFGYFSLLMTAPKATIWGKQGVGSNGRKGQSPFQPDDVLVGAESQELE